MSRIARRDRLYKHDHLPGAPCRNRAAPLVAIELSAKRSADRARRSALGMPSVGKAISRRNQAGQPALAMFLRSLLGKTRPFPLPSGLVLSIFVLCMAGGKPLAIYACPMRM